MTWSLNAHLRLTTTHTSNTEPKFRILKECTSETCTHRKVLTTSAGIASSFSSQEPRRPRFSFFFSSQCQRADPSPSPADTSMRTFPFSMFLQRNTILPRLPGRSSALSDCADQWECLALTSSTLAGSNRDICVCQHPFFVFQ